MTDLGDKAEQLGREVHDHPWLDRGIRFGMVTYGIVYLLIAWLALQLAWGHHQTNASNKGALQMLARQPLGPLLLWLIFVGMVVLTLWRLLEAGVGHREHDGKERWGRRALSLGKAIVYGYVASLALRFALGDAVGGSDSTTARLMAQPLGRWLVGLIGVGIIGYGVAQVRRGWTEAFMESLDVRGATGDAGAAYRRIGKVGYLAKGIAFGLIGGLFVAAAVTHRAQEFGGLDQALHRVLDYPLGQWLLVVIAAGIACYGLFCFVQARHLAR